MKISSTSSSSTSSVPPSNSLFRRASQQLSSLNSWDQITRTIDQVKVVNGVLAAVGSATSIAAAERVYLQNGNRSTVSDVLKILSTIFSILLVIGVSYRYRLEFALRSHGGSLFPTEGYFDSNLRNKYIIELFVCIMHCPAGVYYDFNVSNLGFKINYDLDSVLSVFALLRLYAFIQLFSDSYGLRSAHARVVEKYNKVSFNASFGFRAILDRHPIRTVLACFGISTILFAYALRVFERPVCRTDEAILVGWCSSTTLGIKDYEHFAVAVWNILITETTIGYGDVVAITHAGRVVIGISALSGIVLIALFVTAVSNASQFKPDERRAFDAFLRHKYALQRRTLAKSIIRYFLLYSVHIRRHNKSGFVQKLRNFTQHLTHRSSPNTYNSSVVSAVNINNPLHKGTNNKDNASGSSVQGVVPLGIIRGLVISLGRWREHQREWHELTRDKDVMGILQRDIIEVTTRLSENHLRTCAEIDRLTLHNMALSKQLELLTISTLPGTLAQLETISQQLKIPLHTQFIQAQTLVHDFTHRPLPTLSLDIIADVQEYERRQREMAKIIDTQGSRSDSPNNRSGKRTTPSSSTNSYYNNTNNPTTVVTARSSHQWPSSRTVLLGLEGRSKENAKLNGRALHSRVSDIFR